MLRTCCKWMVFFATTLVSTQSVFCGLVGGKVDGVRRSCSTVSAMSQLFQGLKTHLHPLPHLTAPAIMC